MEMIFLWSKIEIAKQFDCQAFDFESTLEICLYK